MLRIIRKNKHSLSVLNARLDRFQFVIVAYLIFAAIFVWVYTPIDSTPVQADIVEPTPTPTVTPTPSPTSTPTPTPTITPTPTPAAELIEELTPEGKYEEALANGEIDGPMAKHLAKYPGGFMGPSGRETYYNLKMGVVVKNMRKLGYSEEEYPYWIRSDGAKMFGNYVMVAANWKIRPRGTIIKTSLGSAIVVDTGEFVKDYPKGVDVAVNW